MSDLKQLIDRRESASKRGQLRNFLKSAYPHLMQSEIDETIKYILSKAKT